MAPQETGFRRYRTDTWSELLSVIRSIREAFQDPSVTWYRGQSSASYNLVPSLLRYPTGFEKEQILFNEYERSAAHLQAKRSNDWELLIDMQHYGIPTRLMDWTDVLGIAIAFALLESDNSVNEDPAIWVLDPVGLNKMSGLEEIKRVPNDPDFKYKSIYWHGKPFKAGLPIAVDCALQNDRIRAQSGCFTVHGMNNHCITRQAPGAIQQVILGSGAKKEALEFLEHANLSVFSLYPDIVGMARHIARKHLTFRR
jgi:hypothetical protein